jgi:hypothetical protein
MVQPNCRNLPGGREVEGGGIRCEEQIEDPHNCRELP